MGSMGDFDKNKRFIKFNPQSDHNYCRILAWKAECQARLAFPSEQGFFTISGSAFWWRL